MRAAAPVQPIDTESLEISIDAFRRAELSPASEKGYRHDWDIFVRWCERANLQSLPASPHTLGLYLADRLITKKVVSVCRSAAAVAFIHKREGFPSPLDESVRRILRGARRTRAEQSRQMRPLTVVQLRQVCAKLIQGTTARAARDRAIVVIGFATGLRRINLAALRMEDVTCHVEGAIFLVRQEKNDKQSHGRLVGVPYGRNPQTCPIDALEAWLAVRGRQNGPLFTRLDRGRASETEPLSCNAIAKVVKAAISRAGIDAGQFCTHSLRAGIITEAGIAGASALVIGAHVGHKSADSTARYFRPANLFRTNPAGLVGL